MWRPLSAPESIAPWIALGWHGLWVGLHERFLAVPGTKLALTFRAGAARTGGAVVKHRRQRNQRAAHSPLRS